LILSERRTIWEDRNFPAMTVTLSISSLVMGLLLACWSRPASTACCIPKDSSTYMAWTGRSSMTLSTDAGRVPSN
jgi:hypothetical protein